jgi:hypothetical protein
MSNWVQYEVWGVVDGRDELVECVPTLKEAEEILNIEFDSNEFYTEMFILEDRDDVLKEIRRQAR